MTHSLLRPRMNEALHVVSGFFPPCLAGSRGKLFALDPFAPGFKLVLRKSDGEERGALCASPRIRGIESLVERVRAGSRASAANSDGGDVQAHRNIGIGRAFSEPDR